MRDWLKSKTGWLWVLLPLAVPSCGVRFTFEDGGPIFNPGAPPYTSAIFCDIESNWVPPRCATEEDLATGVPLARAAVALVREESSNIGLDFTPSVIQAHGCLPGQPVAITFHGPFPDGLPVCLNCAGVIGPVYPDVEAACAARCLELSAIPADDFCNDTAHARPSTNTNGCVAGACSDEGSLDDAFEDPRRTLEPVQWVNLIGTATSGTDGNTLTKISPTAMPSAFDAGASSDQLVTHGDAYVEFTVVQTDRTRGVGFATGTTDVDPTLDDVDFAISLSSDGQVFVVENGVAVNDATPFGTYAAEFRMRVALTDNLDGTALVTYFVIPDSCAEAGCEGDRIYTSDHPATYPLRVDASLRELGATLDDVRLVRIR